MYIYNLPNEPARDPLLISEHGHFRLIHDGGMYPFVERTIDTAFRFYNLFVRSRIIIYVRVIK